MATYYNITAHEMEEFLKPQGFVLLTLAGTKELVYGKAVGNKECPLTLRIFTGINPTGESREVGKDAIRAALVWKNPRGEVKGVGSSKRVHRVEGWKANLQKRIDAWKEQMPPACPNCGALMAERSSKHGDFWGCTSYPECKGTVNMVTSQ